MTPRAAARTAALVSRAVLHGYRPGLARIIITACRRYDLPISVGFALIWHESGGRKVFGHDPTIFVGAGLITKTKWLAYRSQRRASGNKLMQGAAEPQLTWYETQDLADARGGCWKAGAAVDVAIETLAARIREVGYVRGVARYNGSGPAAERYSREVRAEAVVWHRWLAGAKR